MAVQIKRYANRKLYNTETSRYITLGDISELVRDGHEVRVVDNETGHDISSLVLSRVLVDAERRGAEADGAAQDTSLSGTSPTQPVLGELLQRQLASLVTLLRRYAEDVQGNLTGVRDNVVRWIQAGGPADGSHPPLEIDSEKFERAVRVAVNDALRELDLPTRADLERLEQRLERVLDALQRSNSST